MNEIITIVDGSAILKPEISAQIAQFERQAKEIEEKEKTLKQAILDAMEANNIIKIDTEELTISYVAPTDREKFDTKRFRSEFPATYDSYVTMTPVKASIRIKVK